MTGRVCEACGQTVRTKLTTSVVAAAHVVYRRGASLDQIAEKLWRGLGYASPAAAAKALRDAFDRHGLPLRSKSEAVALANRRRAA